MEQIVQELGLTLVGIGVKIVFLQISWINLVMYWFIL